MYTYALPVLLQHQMQGTFFIIVGTADRQDPKKLSWDEIEAMARDGMAIESHTYNSHYEVKVNGRLVPVFNTPIVVNGQTESTQQYETRVYNDFVKARTELSQALGQPVDEFAWPYGYGSREATALAREAGYAYLFTTADGYVTARSNPLYIHRIDVGKSNITPEQAVQDVLQTATAVPVVSDLVRHAETVIHAHHDHPTGSTATGQALVAHSATGQVPAGGTKSSVGAGAGDHAQGIQAQMRSGQGQTTGTGRAQGAASGNSLSGGLHGPAGDTGAIRSGGGGLTGGASSSAGNTLAGTAPNGATK
ncbi:MAG: polysaccharide deacetylase family protein, partial [Alicyclobacillus sp.]|nr:polysaccharide deacetylase family protein [Alicyclobacillus sp.]